MLVGVQAEQFPQRALVAVGQAEARDHLGDREPGAVSARLEPDEPVADPRHGGEQDSVGDLDVADAERGCQGWLHRAKGRRDGFAIRSRPRAACWPLSVAFPDQSQARQGQQRVHLVDRLAVGGDRPGQAAGRDEGRLLAERIR